LGLCVCGVATSAYCILYFSCGMRHVTFSRLPSSIPVSNIGDLLRAARC
jgi:hypothetical protein